MHETLPSSRTRWREQQRLEIAPKVAVLEADERFAALLEHHVSSAWSEAEVRPIDDPEALVRLIAADCRWVAVCDHVTLEALLPGETSGPQWLARLRDNGRELSPIVLADPSDELLAVRYLKAGAADYLPKRLLDHDLFVRALRERNEQAQVEHELTGHWAEPPSDDDGCTTLPRRFHGRRRRPEVAGYDLIRSIGTGGMAKIYLARCALREREVVLKVLYLDDANGPDSEIARRFEREYRLLGSVRSPHVVDIFDYGLANQVCYMAMEYFPEGDLLTRMQQHVAVDEAVDYVRQIARALGHIHSLDIVHRDLKPANVMLRDPHSVALIDFGMAKHVQSDEMMTATGSVFGTPHYLSPEQADGLEADERSDLYALGVIFYELLTGTKPFTGSTAFEVCISHLGDPIPRLPATLANFQPMIDGLLAKEPNERYQRAGELLACLGSRAGDGT